MQGRVVDGTDGIVGSLEDRKWDGIFRFGSSTFGRGDSRQEIGVDGDEVTMKVG